MRHYRLARLPCQDAGGFNIYSAVSKTLIRVFVCRLQLNSKAFKAALIKRGRLLKNIRVHSRHSMIFFFPARKAS